MANYFVNTNPQPNGDHEVHRDGCYWLTLVANPRFLGAFATCGPAVQAAKNLGYHKANGCIHCSPLCHTS